MSLRRLPDHSEYIYCVVSPTGETSGSTFMIVFLRLNGAMRSKLQQFRTVWNATQAAIKLVSESDEHLLNKITLFDGSIEVEYAERHSKLADAISVDSGWTFTNTTRKPRGTPGSMPSISCFALDITSHGLAWRFSERYSNDYRTPLLFFTDVEQFTIEKE